MAAAGDMITRARTHIKSAILIASSDPTLSLSACHDAARQAVAAHMRAAGYRPANQMGAHRLVIEYADAVLGEVIASGDIPALDELRRDRHTAEYGEFAARTITADRARDAIALAGRIVDAIAANLVEQHRPST